MPNRKLFLVLASICIAPLLILALLLYVTNLRTARRSLRTDLDRELAIATSTFDALVAKRNEERLALARSRSVVDYLGIIKNRSPADYQVSNAGITLKGPDKARELEPYLKDVLSSVLKHDKSYSAIACFDSSKRLMFVAELSTLQPNAPSLFRTQDFLHQESQPDEKTWSAKEGESACGIVSNSFTGRTLRCATPVYAEQTMAGAVVTDLKLHELLSEVAHRAELSSNGQGNGGPIQVVVLDQSGEIVYHTNSALRHQQVNSSFAEFGPVAGPMMAGESGVKSFDSGGGHWLAVYSPLKSAGLSLAIARNSSLEVGDARKWGLLGLGIAIVLGLGTAGILATQYQRKSRGIERVAEDVAAIAKGELDHEVDVRSREDMRPLAENVNLVTKRLREQIARESETRQFQSFVRLSAMLTHDLKNAIGGLSLLVSNMEAHYANEEFRADAMNSLTTATEKLKSLVERLSNPVTTLSGEYKLPAPVDLVPIIKRIVPQTFGRISGSHHLEMQLPASLIALVDGERIEKVIENLVLNGLEAMHGNAGTLRIEGGKEPDGKVFLTVSDTGVGMSKPFMDEKLFHAFATTKKNGMGLGLYTCREVVFANGGTIDVTSKPGDGTTFRVVLPAPPVSGQ